MTNNNKKKLVAGVGFNDMANNSHTKSYKSWVRMINRCYNEGTQKRQPTYKGCSVDSKWHTYSIFKNWYDAQNNNDLQLDKDIVTKGNKIYGPDYCHFVPSCVNSIINNCTSRRGQFKVGVSWNKIMKKYMAYVAKDGKLQYIGNYNTESEAFAAYKIEKEFEIKRVAVREFQKGTIDQEVYNSLMNWVV